MISLGKTAVSMLSARLTLFWNAFVLCKAAVISMVEVRFEIDEKVKHMVKSFIDF